MKILNAEQIREWDQYTIQHEPVSSISLMERAATKCFEWLEQNNFLQHSFSIFCGKGNNGGDGLALARMLMKKGIAVSVYILEFGNIGTKDFQTNLERLHQLANANISFIQTEKNFPGLSKYQIVIDALLGSGLNRQLAGVTADLVHHINQSGCKIISIDIPSGLPVDKLAKGNSIIEADDTLSFQTWKLNFLLPENSKYVGEVHVLDINLHPQFYESVETNFELIDKKIISAIYQPRKPFAHKGNFGHALIIAGSYGKIGAAVMCAKACLRSGAGLTTCHIPGCGYQIMQATLPEVMVITDVNEKTITKTGTDISKFDSVAIGPGIGTDSDQKKMLEEIFSSYKQPVVLDADALNCISLNKYLLNKIPYNSILTPHPKEFERLFGKSETDLERLELAQQKAKEYNVVILLKGHHSFIATPSGKNYFNSTGNAGMAKGGSGDVLSGMIAALLAQGYSSVEATLLGTYLHGVAGDTAAIKFSQEAMVAGDIIESLPAAFLSLKS